MQKNNKMFKEKFDLTKLSDRLRAWKEVKSVHEANQIVYANIEKNKGKGSKVTEWFYNEYDCGPGIEDDKGEYKTTNGKTKPIGWCQCPDNWADDVKPLLEKIMSFKGADIQQFKEKFDTLRVYYSAPENTKNKIEKLIGETTQKLIEKGFYPTEVQEV